MRTTQKKLAESPRNNVAFEAEAYEQIQLLAAKQHTSMLEVVRNRALQGLSGDLNADNIGLITNIIRTQIQDVMRPSFERLASLSAKTCIQSGTAAYLSAEAILKFVPAPQQQELEESYELARKKAIAYLKGRTNEDE